MPAKKEKKQKSNSVKTQTIRPCQFCRGEAEAKKGYKELGFYVRCKEKNCATTKYHETKDEAISAWNSGQFFLTPTEKFRLSDIAERRLSHGV